MTIDSIAAQVVTRARILPFGRDDCAASVNHRLTIGGARITFAPRAIDVLFGMCGGVPRLVNLISERALREAADRELRRIEPSAIEAAASALEVLRARARRFRWFHERVS